MKKPTDLFGLESESATERDGFLSSRSEWHAVAIGAGVGFVSALNTGKDGAWLLLILAGLALGARQLDIGPLGGLSREPHYGLAAAVIAFLLTSFFVVPMLPRAVF
jgi:hypothetical protein